MKRSRPEVLVHSVYHFNLSAVPRARTVPREKEGRAGPIGSVVEVSVANFGRAASGAVLAQSAFGTLACPAQAAAPLPVALEVPARVPGTEAVGEDEEERKRQQTALPTGEAKQPLGVTHGRGRPPRGRAEGGKEPGPKRSEHPQTQQNASHLTRLLKPV